MSVFAFKDSKMMNNVSSQDSANPLHTFYLSLARSILPSSSSTNPPTETELLLALRREINTFLLLYQFGISEILTKINILQSEHESRHSHKVIEHLNSRVKSTESLLAKAQRLKLPPTLSAIRSEIRDIAGIRITCSFVEDVYTISELLTSQADITVLETKDYIINPKGNGYKSLHLILQIPVFLAAGIQNIPVEVQIRTIAMDFWASLEHKIYYKYERVVPEHLVAELKEAAETASALDVKMARLRDEIRGDRKKAGDKSTCRLDGKE